MIVDDENLEQILDASIEKWRVFLHPMQRKIVELDANGPVRVLGGAGTGKTVVAMHRAVHLATKVFNGERDRILFTTYTRNLAADIEENLRKICEPDAMRRIEVINLDQWVQNFLKRQGYPHNIQYYTQGSGILHELWENALAMRPELDLPRTFYREEWEYVVQAQGCATLRDYLTARRSGRGLPLQRPDRKEIWRVFEEYRNQLTDRGIRERSDAIRDACQILKSEGDILAYRAVLLDEAQDMGEEAFQLIRQLVPDERDNDLFIVGDGHQRIYRRPVIMKHCGINIVGRNRSHRLRINYRTTDEIRRFAVGLLEGLRVDDLDGDADRSDRYKSLMHGQPPAIVACESFEKEVDAIVEFVKQEPEHERASTCLVARTQRLVDQYGEALTSRGIETFPISRTRYDDRREPGLRLATMHRVKGLEFNRVIIAGANEDVVPLRHLMTSTEDESVLEDLEMRERALLYVAVTRAKKDAMVSFHGKGSAFLPQG
ncbi:MAG: ATP-dependent helicase [Chthoniobacterales bacterium]|nr:ATP-dependent helicase [Chthoniobacterales bacterium]